MLTTLLTPLSENEPCGSNLEYDADFLDMMQASSGTPEQQFGETVIPAVLPDWKRVERLALGLLGRTRDLRIMVCLTQAWVHSRGIAGYAEGLRFISVSLETYWDSLFPRIEWEGEREPLYRLNVLAALSDHAPLARWIARIPPLASLDTLATGREAPNGLTPAPISSGKSPLIQSEWSADLLQHCSTIVEALEKIKNTLATHLGEEHVPDMQKTLQLFSNVASHRRNTGELKEHPTETPSREEGATQSLSDTLRPHWRDIDITCREDVHCLLEKVNHYFQHHEPGHPAPLMIARAQRLINANFMDIMQNLLPEISHQLETLFGTKDSHDPQ